MMKITRYALLCALLPLVSLPTFAQSPRAGWQSQKVDWQAPGDTRVKKIYFPADAQPPFAKGKKQHKGIERQVLSNDKNRKSAALDRLGIAQPETDTPPVALVIDSPPVDGIVPWIAVTATDDAAGELELDAIPYGSVIGNALSTNPATDYAIGIWDTGASTTVVGHEAGTTLGLFNGYTTLSTIEITGVTGSVFAWVSQPIGLFMTGLGEIDPQTSSLNLNHMIGLGNVSVAVGQQPGIDEPDLPTALGAPMSVWFAAAVDNSVSHTVSVAGQDYTGPDISFTDYDDPNLPDYSTIVPLELRPLGGISIQYIPCLELTGACSSGFGAPSSPSIIIGNSSQSLFFVASVDLYDRQYSAIDKDRFIIDTGAQVSVVGSRIGARLNLDPNHPQFEVEVQGVDGTTSLVPGYYLDRIDIPALGQWLSFTRVPVILLDVASPEGGTLDGIVGMNLFNNYNFVLRGGGLFTQPDPTLELELIAPEVVDVDFDDDSDLDLADFAHMQTCYTGPDTVQLDPACFDTLLDADSDTDADDLALFAGCLSAPGVPADADCR